MSGEVSGEVSDEVRSAALAAHTAAAHDRRRRRRLAGALAFGAAWVAVVIPSCRWCTSEGLIEVVWCSTTLSCGSR